MHCDCSTNPVEHVVTGDLQVIRDALIAKGPLYREQN